MTKKGIESTLKKIARHSLRGSELPIDNNPKITAQKKIHHLRKN